MKMEIYITKVGKEYYSLRINDYQINKLTPHYFNRVYDDVGWLMYDTYKTLFNVKLEHPINEYIKLAEKHNCKIIEQTINRRILKLPVFTSLKDAEAMRREIELKRLLIDLED